MNVVPGEAPPPPIWQFKTQYIHGAPGGPTAVPSLPDAKTVTVCQARIFETGSQGASLMVNLNVKGVVDSFYHVELTAITQLTCFGEPSREI